MQYYKQKKSQNLSKRLKRFIDIARERDTDIERIKFKDRLRDIHRLIGKDMMKDIDKEGDTARIKAEELER